MARRGRAKAKAAQARAARVALPPERRTVGQLVAESIRLYGARPPVAFLIGVLVAAVNLLVVLLPRGAAVLAAPLAGGLVLTPAYLLAASAATRAPLRTRSALSAYLAGIVVFFPFPFLVTVLILPGLAWLALFGLAVPAALVERLSVWAALKRGLALARADYVHVLGGLAALALVVFVVQAAVYVVLRAYAESAAAAAAALAALVASPTLFFGAALLYVDQEARLRSAGKRGKERHADLPDADEAHRTRGADAAREPGPSA